MSDYINPEPEMDNAPSVLPAEVERVYDDAPMSQDSGPGRVETGENSLVNYIGNGVINDVVAEQTDENSTRNIKAKEIPIVEETVQMGTSRIPFPAQCRRNIANSADKRVPGSESEFRSGSTATLPLSSHAIYSEDLLGNKIVEHTRFPTNDISWGPSQSVDADGVTKDVLSIIGLPGLDSVRSFTAEPGISLYSDTESFSGDTGAALPVLDREFGRVQRPEKVIISQAELDKKIKHAASTQHPHLGYPDAPSRPAVLRRTGSHRPPPSTPPEPAVIERLSMPTLPALFNNTVPDLLKQYQAERAADPNIFDKTTRDIQEHLIQAKIERGGSAELLHNEYSAELASRLDAERVSKWGVLRQHDFQYEGSDTDEPAIGPGLSPGTVPVAVSISDDGSREPNASRKLSMWSAPTAGGEHRSVPMHFMPLGFRLSEHVRKVTTSGSVRFRQAERVETVLDQHKKVVQSTWIEITEEFIYHDEDELSWEDVLEAKKQEEARKKQSDEQSEKKEKKPTRDDFPDLDSDSVEVQLSDVLRALVRLRGFNGDRKELDPKLIRLATEMDERIWQLKAEEKLKVHREG